MAAQLSAMKGPPARDDERWSPFPCGDGPHGQRGRGDTRTSRRATVQPERAAAHGGQRDAGGSHAAQHLAAVDPGILGGIICGLDAVVAHGFSDRVVM